MSTAVVQSCACRPPAHLHSFFPLRTMLLQTCAVYRLEVMRVRLVSRVSSVPVHRRAAEARRWAAAVEQQEGQLAELRVQLEAERRQRFEAQQVHLLSCWALHSMEASRLRTWLVCTWPQRRAGSVWWPLVLAVAGTGCGAGRGRGRQRGRCCAAGPAAGR